MPVIKRKEPTKASIAKRYLMQVRWIDDDIKRTEEDIQELETMAQGVKGIAYDRDKVQTSLSDCMSNAVVKILEKKAQLVEEDIRLIELRSLIRSQISNMPDPIHRQILFRYYLSCNSFEKIASDMNYSYQYIINAHGRALQAFQRRYLSN